uniref:Secreted protein n=1 Tax=Anopheles darlingi TaxID=43151 RepID=A0A2M4DDY8_ANODA
MLYCCFILFCASSLSFDLAFYCVLVPESESWCVQRWRRLQNLWPTFFFSLLLPNVVVAKAHFLPLFSLLGFPILLHGSIYTSRH